MPTYQYACTACGERTEVVQKFTDDPLTVCAVCEGRLRKVYSPVGIVFKGSGFYRTDSRNGANGANGKTPVGSEAGSTASKSANGDSGSGGSATSGGDKKAGGSADSGSAAPAAASSKSVSSAGAGSKVA